MTFTEIACVIVGWEIGGFLWRATVDYVEAMQADSVVKDARLQAEDAEKQIGLDVNGKVKFFKIKTYSDETVGIINEWPIHRYLRVEDNRLFEYEGMISWFKNKLAREDETCEYLILEPGLMYREMVGYH